MSGAWKFTNDLDGTTRTIQPTPFEADSFTGAQAKAAVEITKADDPRFDNIRPANPKQAYGDKKVPLQLIPPAALIYMGQALKEGARKYGAYNWRENDVEVMTYIGATMRHVAAYLDREDVDPESGNHHLAHALASLAILVDSIECGVSIDNRPPEGAAGKLIRD